MAEFQSYIVCATPRSGTTLLCDLLAETGVAGRPNSYFRRQNISDWARDWGVPLDDESDPTAFDSAYLAAVIQAGASENGVFGLRLMWDSVSALSACLLRLYPGLQGDAARFERVFGKTLYLHLSRQDKVGQAVSRLKAEQSGLWHLAADGTERERTSPAQPVVYDADRLSGFVAEQEADDAAWAKFFADNRIEPVGLTYEALTAAPQAALAGILAALGLEPARARTAKVRTAKLADHTSREWADRFRREGVGSKKKMAASSGHFG